VAGSYGQKEEVSLTDGKVVSLLSPNYPEDVPAFTDKEWSFTAPPGSQILLSCSELILYKITPECAEYGLHVELGSRKVAFCGNLHPFKEVSEDNRMRVRLEIGKWNVGKVKCDVSTTSTVVTAPAHPLEASGPLTRVHLKYNEEAYVLKNPEYPEQSLQHFPRWIITADPGYKVGIYCFDVRFAGGADCTDHGYGVKLQHDGEEKVLCSDGGAVSKGEPKITVTILKNMIWPNYGGSVACRVNSVKSDKAFEPYLAGEFEEEDSSEHGVVPGKKGTTCKCGWANKDAQRIIGGVTAKPNEFPFMVALLQNGKQNCGASILTNTFALTAAHCTVKYRTEELSVGVGISDLQIDTEWVQKIQVAEKIEHSEYSPPKGYANDIALLRLERPITFNEMVGPICMPHNLPRNMNNKKLTTMGWGLVDQMKGILDTELQKASARIVDPVTCKWTSGGNNLNVDKPLKMCYFGVGNSTATCNGDSGSPVVWVDPETNRYTQLSLVSYSQGYCKSLVPNVGTNVVNYMDWIKQYVHDGLCMKSD